MVAKSGRRVGFTELLSSAVSEWFLIGLLLLHAWLSYLVTRFASYCHLETPCLLCSNYLHHKKAASSSSSKRGYYWNLLCSHHRQEISCLVSCSIHGKFADVHSMCDDCLAPIVHHRSSSSSSSSYRLLVGKSFLDVDRSVLQNLVLNKHVRLLASPDRTCSCCSKTWTTKSTDLPKPNNNNVKPPLPRPPGPRPRFTRKDSLKRLRDKFTGQMPMTSSTVDTLSHVGYTKIKITSDTESEFPFSEEEDDDDDAKSTSSRVVVVPPNIISSGVGAVSSPTTGFLKQHGLDEFEWLSSPSLAQEDLILSDVPGGLFGGGSSSESCKSNVILPHMQALSVLSEFLSLCNIPPSPDSMPTPRKMFDVFGTSENGDNSSEAGNIVDESRSLESTHHTDETREFEPTSTSNSAKTEEDIKPIKVTSPRAHDKPRTDEDDNSSSKALSSIPATPRNPESLDGTAFTDPEGNENSIDGLKRQLENERSLLNSLYKDLDEERNASAIATNQAMAMITRLQEEKAALHMEALQYLRMMEEQAEYDMEALRRANDLLTDKEKELQDLEIELEFYRNNFLDELSVQNLQSETSVEISPVPDVTPKENGVSEPMNSLLANFEEEKLYMERCLKMLEKKLLQASSGEYLDELPNGLRSEKINGTLLIQEIEEDSSLMENVIPLSNGNHDFVHEKSEKMLANRGEISFAKFEKEIKEIYERLEAIEADKDFIKRTCDVLRSGKDGLELVKEIAQQLHELRKMEFVKR